MVYLSESLHLPEVAKYWRAVVEMNEHQKDRFARKVVDTLFNTITGKKIAILGWAFKKDTGDTRESPAISIANHFLSEKARITVYDPQVTEEQIWLDLTDYGSVPAEPSTCSGAIQRGDMLIGQSSPTLTFASLLRTPVRMPRLSSS